nr:MAG TPA: hypothetical protein [Bacteriophage sp.]
MQLKTFRRFILHAEAFFSDRTGDAPSQCSRSFRYWRVFSTSSLRMRSFSEWNIS